MRATTLGIVFIIIGSLVTAYGFSRPFDFFIPFVGIIIMGVGFWILATKFRQWVYKH